MEFQELFSKLNEGKLTPPADKKKWEEASDRISVHAKGIRPQFNNPRQKGNRNGKYGAYGLITPANYEERYQYLFDNYILNRHPNEQEEHYNFRLSIYPLVAEEIYLTGKTQVSGSIFQQSQYTIAANDERGQAYLDSIDFDKRVKEEFFEHILTDPYGKFAVVETHMSDFGSDERAAPDVICIESRYIMHYHPKESILFRASHDIDGRKLLYFIDRRYCVKLLQVEDRRKNAYTILAAYEHGLGEMPVVNIDKYLFKSFATWADLIARNFSDDEIVAKNNNYPHIQMVEPLCNNCAGTGKAGVPCEECEGGYEEGTCGACNGKGTISINPGEVHVIKESEFRPGEMNGAGGMIDRIKFINPDVNISKNAMERAWKIYEAGLRSLHLKYVEEAQSGIAKAIDREQLYLLISDCASVIFDFADRALRYIFGYLQMGLGYGNPYTVEQPTQFQIKTEADIQAEMIALIGADLSVRRQKTDEYMQVVYTGNAVELKKWSVIKVWDGLYCMGTDELQLRKTLNSAQTMDFIKHDKVELLLNQIILDKTADWFVNATVQDIVSELDTRIAPYEPQSEVTIPEDVEL